VVDASPGDRVECACTHLTSFAVAEQTSQAEVTTQQTSSPSFAPSSAPTPEPTGTPKPSLHGVNPTPAPVVATNAPTTSDTVRVDVYFELDAAESPSDDQKDEVRTTLVSDLNDSSGIVDSDIHDYLVTVGTVETRRVLRRRGLLATSYVWAVTFEVVVSLASTTVSSASGLASSIATTLLSGTFEEDLGSNLGIEITVDKSTVSVTVVDRHSTSPTPLPSPLPSRVGGGSGGGNADTASAMIISISVCAAFLLLVVMYMFLRPYILHARHKEFFGEDNERPTTHRVGPSLMPEFGDISESSQSSQMPSE
jgi:hypothetical protein